MSSILFICKNRDDINYGNGTFGLFNSAKFVVDHLCDHGHDANIIQVIDSNHIDKEIVNHNPSLVILEAIWVTPSKLLELSKLHLNVKFVIRIHSKTPFLANEGMAIEWIKLYYNIPSVHIAFNNRECCSDFTNIGITSIWLPNIYYCKYKSPSIPSLSQYYLDIGCFGSLRPMKNHLEQAVSAIIFAEKLGKILRFHINSSRVEQRGEPILKNLRALFYNSRHELIEHNWLTHSEFCDLVCTMHIGMQVSMSESYNIVAADFVNNNIPIVTSNEIPFVSKLFKTNHYNTDEIVRSLYLAYYGKSIFLHRLNNILLNKDINIASDAWTCFLTAVL